MPESDLAALKQDKHKMFGSDVLAFFAFLFPFVEGLAILAAIHAIMKARTSQGAIAWAVSLVTFPWVVLPLYAIFGRSRFNGYVLLRTSKDREVRRRVQNLRKMAWESGSVRTELRQSQKALVNMSDLPLLGWNKSELLIDGENTFSAIFSAIRDAKEYLLIQFFIVKADDLGTRFKDLLLAKAGEGVRIFFLYDEIGSHSLPRRYLAQLRSAGI